MSFHPATLAEVEAAVAPLSRSAPAANSVLVIDGRDPVQRAAMNAVWPLSDAEWAAKRVASDQLREQDRKDAIGLPAYRKGGLAAYFAAIATGAA